VRSAEEAVDDSEIVLAAVKSTTTVLLGQWLKPGMHVNSVGTARRDQRGIDVETFTRSDVIVRRSSINEPRSAGWQRTSADFRISKKPDRWSPEARCV